MNTGYQNAVIDLLRHGEVAGEKGLYGFTDIAVSERGWQQMQLATNIDLQYPQVISSPLQRCMRFAKDFCKRHELNLLPNQEIQEMNFGVWDGKSFEALTHEWQQLEAFWSSPFSVTPPQGESLQNFHDRVIHSWYQILTDCKNTHTLVVCHAGVIRMILAELLHVNWHEANFYQRLRIDYGSLTRIQVLYSPDGQVYPQVRFIGRPNPMI